jgi:hypothetical protein
MDPYLEQAAWWPTFQSQLVATLYQVLLPGLVDRYRAQVCTRQFVSEEPLFTSVIRTEHRDEFIEIRQRQDNRLVTVLDVVSPADKTLPQGRKICLEQRKDLRTARVNLVEIDLVRAGKPLLDYNQENLPRWDYAVTVVRSAFPDRFEIYTATLQKRLPRFKVPLATDDRDTVLDLQATFARCYEQGEYTKKIDYQQAPAPQLADDDARWLADTLRQAKLR